MTVEAPQENRFGIGRVVSRTFALIRSDPATFVAISALFALPGLIFTYSNLFAPMTAPSYPEAARIALTRIGLSSLVDLVFSTLGAASLASGAFAALRGGKAPFGECILASLRDAAPLMAIVLLASLGIVLGVALFLVPGLILTVMWFVVVPVRVNEKTSVGDTFRRSSALSRGYRWQIFALILIVMVPAFILGYSIQSLAKLLVSDPRSASYAAVYMSMHALATIVAALISGLGSASLYYELRLVKEGGEAEHLAQVFA